MDNSSKELEQIYSNIKIMWHSIKEGDMDISSITYNESDPNPLNFTMPILHKLSTLDGSTITRMYKDTRNPANCSKHSIDGLASDSNDIEWNLNPESECPNLMINSFEKLLKIKNNSKLPEEHNFMCTSIMETPRNVFYLEGLRINDEMLEDIFGIRCDLDTSTDIKLGHNGEQTIIGTVENGKAMFNEKSNLVPEVFKEMFSIVTEINHLWYENRKATQENFPHLAQTKNKIEAPSSTHG